MDVLEVLPMWKAAYAGHHKIRRTPAETLAANRISDIRASESQLRTLRHWVTKLGITEDDLMELGITENRLHQDCRLLDPDYPDPLDLLTGPEVGALFCLRPFLSELAASWPN